MHSKNAMIVYTTLLVLGIGLIIFGSVYFTQKSYQHSNNRRELSSENKKYWEFFPYGDESMVQLNITFFNWNNPKEVSNLEQNVKVNEEVLDFLVRENKTITEVSREDNKDSGTEIVTLSSEFKRQFIQFAKDAKHKDDSSSSSSATSKSELIEKRDITLANIGAFKYWNYIKNSPTGTNAIKLLYKQIKELEEYYYVYIKNKVSDLLKDKKSFVESKIFNQLTFSQETKENMYDSFKLSFSNSIDFFQVMTECNHSSEFYKKCDLFLQLYSISKEDFKLMTDNFRSILKDNFNLDVSKISKEDFARYQWGLGQYNTDSIFNKNTTYFGYELFKYAKENYPKADMILTLTQITKLIDYSFVKKNEEDAKYIATKEEKSILFDKSVVDGIYSGEVKSADLDIDLKPEQKEIIINYLKNVIFDDPTKADTNKNNFEDVKLNKEKQRKRVLIELAEVSSQQLYNNANILGFNVFIYLLAKKTKEDFLTKPEECSAKLNLINDLEKAKSICGSFNNFKDITDIEKLILAEFYEDGTYKSTIDVIIDNAEKSDNFQDGVIAKISNYIANINTEHIKNAIYKNYKELDFSVFGLSLLITGQYTEITPYHNLFEISSKLNNVKDFNRYVKDLGKTNPYTDEIVRKRADFSGLFSSNYIRQSFIDNIFDKKELFSVDLFLDYLRDYYISNHLKGLTTTKTIDAFSEISTNEWIISGYEDPILTKLKANSMLLGGNPTINSKINPFFERDNVLSKNYLVYSGKNNTELSRKIISMNSDSKYKNKFTVNKPYYPGNNGKIVDKVVMLENKSLIRNSLNATDSSILSTAANRKTGEIVESSNAIGFIFDDIFGKVVVNFNSTDSFSKAVTLEKHNMNNTMQYSSNDNNVIELSEAFDYPLVASMKYFNNSKLKNKVTFVNKTALNINSFQYIEKIDDDENIVNNSEKESTDKSDDPAKKEEADTTNDPDIESWIKIDPKTGLAVSSSLNFMYSIIIDSDDLFKFKEGESKVIPLFFKSTKLKLSKAAVDEFLGSIFGDLLASSLLLYFGIGFTTFGLLMLGYSVFKPELKPEIIRMSSNVSTYGVFPDEVTHMEEQRAMTINHNRSESSKEVVDVPTRNSRLNKDGNYYNDA